MTFAQTEVPTPSAPTDEPSGVQSTMSFAPIVRATAPDVPPTGTATIPQSTFVAGVMSRPFPSICGIDDKDFNEVFFTDVRVPAENLVGPLNGGWGVANGSLGHERTMMWLGFADRTLGLRLPQKNRQTGAAIRERRVRHGAQPVQRGAE